MSPASAGSAFTGPASTGAVLLGRVARGRPPAAQSSWRIPGLPRRLEYSQLIAAWLRENPETESAEATHAAGRSRVPIDIDGDGTAGARASRYRVPIGIGEDSRDGERASRCRVPIGIGGDDARALALDLNGAPMTLLVGPGGSGRTSALQCIADGLERLGEPALWVSLSHVGPAEVATITAALVARPDLTVLVDDTPAAVAGSPADQVGELLAARAGTGRLVIGTSSPEVLGAYRGLLTQARTARSGLLLRSGNPGDAEVFGLRPERRPPGPPGRALLVQGGRAVSLQLALPSKRDP